MSRKVTPLRNSRSRTSFVTDFDQLKAEVLASQPNDPQSLTLSTIPVERLQRGLYQPRKAISEDDIEDLTSSIKELGILEPLVVRPTDKEGHYEILAGERRWLAAQKAGLKMVPVVIRQVDNKTAAVIALVENLQREDLNPIEEATALRRLANEFELSQTQVSQLVSKSKSAISRVMGLLELAPSVQEYIGNGKLEAGHGKVLLSLQPDVQTALADKTIKHGWSVRELEKQKTLLNSKRKGRRKLKPDPDLQQLETRISEWLAAPVVLKPNSKGGGRIEIIYSNVDTCQSILERMGMKEWE